MNKRQKLKELKTFSKDGTFFDDVPKSYIKDVDDDPLDRYDYHACIFQYRGVKALMFNRGDGWYSYIAPAGFYNTFDFSRPDWEL